MRTTKLIKVMNGNGNFRFEERTQFDQDIEDTHKELLGRGKARKEREQRQYARKMQMISLNYQIKKAIEAN